MFRTLLLLLGSICCLSYASNLSNDQKSDEKYHDGRQYYLKTVDTTYTQHVSNHGQCTIELNNEEEHTSTLTEGEIVQIKMKWFKVEDCRLNRAYVASCGSKLFRQMRDVVCSYVAKHPGQRLLNRRQTADDLIDLIDRSYYGLCCKSACTIAELAQQCSSKW